MRMTPTGVPVVGSSSTFLLNPRSAVWLQSIVVISSNCSVFKKSMPGGTYMLLCLWYILHFTSKKSQRREGREVHYTCSPEPDVKLAGERDWFRVCSGSRDYIVASRSIEHGR